MAVDVGAKLDRMDQALLFGTTAVSYEGGVRGSPAGDYYMPHSMIVNRHGQRFMNEKAMNFALAFEEKDSESGAPLHLPAWRIYDSQFASKYPMALPKTNEFAARVMDTTLDGPPKQIRVDPAAVLAHGQVMLELDLVTASAEEVWFEGQLEFVPVRDGVLNGFCVWFEAELSPSVILDTGPFSPETHWAQTYMSFSPRPVRAGERVDGSVDFSNDSEPADVRRHVDLCLGVGEHELSYVID